MKPRDLAALALLVLAVGLEVMVFRGVSTVAGFALYERDHAARSLGTFFALSHGVALLGTLVGGALALGIGPRFTAAGGALVATLGCFALAAGVPEEVFYLVSFGCGVLRPCPIVAAAEVIAWNDPSPDAPGPHRFTLVAAFGAALAVAGNGGGFVAGAFANMGRASLGAAVTYGGAGVMLIFATALLTVAAVLGVRWSRGAAAPVVGPYREPTAPASVVVPRPRALAGLGKLLGLQVGVVLMEALTSPPGALRASASTASTAWLYALPAAVVVLGSGLTLGVLVVMSIQRSSWPPLLLQGGAMVVFALGLVPLAMTSTSMATFGAGTLLTGLATTAATCVPLAYAALALRGRAATLVVAGWLAIEAVVGQGGTILNFIEPARVPLLVAGALLCLGGGVVLLRFGRTLHRDFDGTEGRAQP
jgi:hypothetical protein